MRRRGAGPLSSKPGLRHRRRPASGSGARLRAISSRSKTPALSSDEVRKRVCDSPVATLATVGGDGRPDLVPITYALDGDVLYSIVDHKPKRTRDLRRLANIKRDGNVTLLVDHYEDDWTRLWWCRLRGVAHVDDPTEDALELLRAKYEQQYGGVVLDGPMIVVAVNGFTGWTALG